MQLRDKKLADARETLRHLAFNPHGGEMAEYATKIVAAIDSGGDAAALKIIDEAESPKQGGLNQEPGRTFHRERSIQPVEPLPVFAESCANETGSRR